MPRTEAALKARRKIVDKAWAFRLRNGRSVKPITMRHLNEAVCICRRNRLVSRSTLAAAGFNPTER